MVEGSPKPPEELNVNQLEELVRENLYKGVSDVVSGQIDLIRFHAPELVGLYKQYANKLGEDKLEYLAQESFGYQPDVEHVLSDIVNRKPEDEIGITDDSFYQGVHSRFFIEKEDLQEEARRKEDKKLFDLVDRLSKVYPHF